MEMSLALTLIRTSSSERHLLVNFELFLSSRLSAQNGSTSGLHAVFVKPLSSVYKFNQAAQTYPYVILRQSWKVTSPEDSIEGQNLIYDAHVPIFVLPVVYHTVFLLSKTGRWQGIRIVAPSRPGSGGSNLRENCSLLDYPQDLLALADYFGISRFGTIAVSGRAPYSFACRQRIPHSRLVGMGIVAGIYLVASLGTVDMKLPSQLILPVSSWFPSIVTLLIDKQLGTVAGDEGETRMEALLVADMQQDWTSESEKVTWEVANPEVRKAVVMSVRECDRYGGRGPGWEWACLEVIVGLRWKKEIQPSEKGELIMWHGIRVDVPRLMAEEAAVQLRASAGLRIVEGQGHDTLTFHNADETIETMKGTLNRSWARLRHNTQPDTTSRHITGSTSMVANWSITH
jgi:pimeloyl-ACP methyl ester carboxylesterase